MLTFSFKNYKKASFIPNNFSNLFIILKNSNYHRIKTIQKEKFQGKKYYKLCSFLNRNDKKCYIWHSHIYPNHNLFIYKKYNSFSSKLSPLAKLLNSNYYMKKKKCICRGCQCLELQVFYILMLAIFVLITILFHPLQKKNKFFFSFFF